MKFGPYNLNIPSRLIFNNLELEITDSVNHFWGENGAGKSTLINEIVEDCISSKENFSYINQNYRQNWLWWLSLEQNLELAVYGNLKSHSIQNNLKNILNKIAIRLGIPASFAIEEKAYRFLEMPEIKSQLFWLNPLLNSGLKQVDFSREAEISSIDLSGGQLQRVILLRELLRKPKFLILDEAFSALDKKVLPEILDWLKTWQEKYPFILISISHDKTILEKLPGTVWTVVKNDNLEMQLSSNKTENSYD